MSEAAVDDLEERARKLFAGPIEFLKSAPELKFLPDPDVPEIAFAGRSNVGKSALLNALTNRKGLARTSNTPGRTDTVAIRLARVRPTSASHPRAAARRERALMAPSVFNAA